MSFESLALTAAEFRHVDRSLPDPSAPYAALVWLCDRTPVDSPARARKREYARQYNALCRARRKARTP